VGLTYRQLDYWVRKGWVEPSLEKAKGSGTARLFSEADLRRMVEIKTAFEAAAGILERAGIKMRRKHSDLINVTREGVTAHW
jgi:hypothetical protein